MVGQTLIFCDETSYEVVTQLAKLLTTMQFW